MALTLDYIIAFLTDQKFEIKSNDLLDGQSTNTFPDEFNKLFDKRVDRYGLKNRDTMIYDCILFCADSTYRNLVEEDKELYRMALSKELLRNIKKDENEILIAASCYMDINIFVFNFDDSKIYLYYPEKVFNKYKNNIFIAKNGKNMEPIIQKDNIFNYKNNILNDVLCYQNIITNKEFIIGGSIEEILFMNQKVVEENSDSELNYNKKVSKALPIEDDDDDDDYKEIIVVPKEEIPSQEEKPQEINPNWKNKAFLKRQKKDDLLNILNNNPEERKKLEKNTKDILITMIIDKYK